MRIPNILLPEHKKLFHDCLFKWYSCNKRDLPWRNIREPYRIWVSEIILQQTRVNQGLPYYHRFMQEFPALKQLAESSLTSVLKVWQGLGYYSRARNMHQAAKQIMDVYGGKFPASYNELLTLKGIGKYTAAAISSFAWKIPVPVMDGNVQRVISRLMNYNKPVNTSFSNKYLNRIAHNLISIKKPDIFNQAMMELGALVCIPNNPSCRACPVHKFCKAFNQKTQAKIPVILNTQKIRKRYFYYAVLRCGDKFLIRERKNNDIWKGLFDFYLIESVKPLKTKHVLSLLNNAGFSEIQFIRETKIITHQLSHQQLKAKFLIIESANEFSINDSDEYRWVLQKELKNYPWSRLAEKFFAEHLSQREEFSLEKKLR